MTGAEESQGGGERIVLADGTADERLRAAVLEMWLEHHAIPSMGEAERRLSELIAVALDERGRALGVSTAGLMVNRAGEKVYAYRTFVRPESRGRRWLQKIWLQSEACFRARLAADASAPRAVVFFAENPKWESRGPRRDLERFGFRFVGHDPKGQSVWRIELT